MDFEEDIEEMKIASGLVDGRTTSPRSTVILLSGPTGVGKTTLAQRLCETEDIEWLSTSKIIRELIPATKSTRRSLQNAGNNLDQESKYAWIANATRELLKNSPALTLVVDAVRKPQQVSVFRSRPFDEVIHLDLLP